MSKPIVDREQTSPFLLRTFVKVNGYHRLGLFEDNTPPIADEHQIYTWKDATLREIVTSLRALPPSPLTSSLRHPHARFNFRVIYSDQASTQGRISSREIGFVSARELAQIINLDVGNAEEQNGAPAPDADDDETVPKSAIEDNKAKEREKKPTTERTLDELRVHPGNWLDVAVLIPAKPGQPLTGISPADSVTPIGWNGQMRGAAGAAAEPAAAPQGSWRGGAPHGPVSGPRRNSAIELDAPRGPRGGSNGRGGGYGDRGGRGGRGGIQLNRRGMPRRGSPDRTLGGHGTKRDRSRSYSRSRSRSLSPRRKARSPSGSPMRD